MLKRQFEGLLRESEVIDIDEKSKIIFFSDCHRGNGGRADDFAHNQLIYIAAIKHYLKQDFTYIELGDGDELWENKNFERIKLTYRTIFELFDEFHQKNRFYFIWGNHNRRWKNVDKFQQQFTSIIDDETNERKPILQGLKSHEALVLKYRQDEEKRILVVHGHQGEMLNDRLWWLGRFGVRKVWGVGQLFLGIPDPTSAARNYRLQKKSDEKFRQWVSHSGIPLIIGHTHNPVFPSEGEVSYFNDGCCVHPRCITGLEIDKGQIQLIKWFVDVSDNNTLSIQRELLAGPRLLESLFGG
jgi:UDP-2,3-diacylglucosamine pyrophosphatase LpxH